MSTQRLSSYAHARSRITPSTRRIRWCWGGRGRHRNMALVPFPQRTVTRSTSDRCWKLLKWGRWVTPSSSNVSAVTSKPLRRSSSTIVRWTRWDNESWSRRGSHPIINLAHVEILAQTTGHHRSSSNFTTRISFLPGRTRNRQSLIQILSLKNSFVRAMRTCSTREIFTTILTQRRRSWCRQSRLSFAQAGLWSTDVLQPPQTLLHSMIMDC